MKLNKTDRAILQALQEDGKLSNVALAEQVSLSESACLRRVKALEQAGIIDHYAMIISPETIGISGHVVVEITLNSQEQKDLTAFEQAIRKIPEVMECYLMSGDFDYFVQIVVKDIQDYERIHHDSLTKLPGVSRVKSSFSLRMITKRTALPL